MNRFFNCKIKLDLGLLPIEQEIILRKDNYLVINDVLNRIKLQILNRKAHFNYDIEEETEVGIVLLGSEVKSLREAKANLNEAYVAEISGELFLVNCNISEYKGANRFNHAPKRQRKLLLHKKQLEKIIGKMQIKGYSVVPLKIFFNKKNFAKILIGLGRGKKLYDKRESIKKRDEKRRQKRGEE